MLNLLRKVYRSSLIKTPDIRRKLIVFTSFLILLLIIVNVLLFYFSMRKTYLEQLESSNESIVQQIAVSCETVIKYIVDSVCKTSLYDRELSELVKNYDNSFGHQNNISLKLDNIVLFNEFIQSAYLYLPKYNQVFSTSNNVSKIASYDNFSDQSAFAMVKEKSLYSLDPRTVQYGGEERLILSVVSSVPLYNHENKAFLVVNISMSQLQYDILSKLETEQNIRFYVLNHEKSIIIAKGLDTHFGKFMEKEAKNEVSYEGFWGNLLRSKMVITTVYNSDFLNWTFIIETSVGAQKGFDAKLSRFIMISLLLIIISLGVIIIMIMFYTKPVKGIILKYGEKLWKDFISDSLCLTDEIREQLGDGQFPIRDAKFGTLVLCIEANDLTAEALNRYVSELKELIHSLAREQKHPVKVIFTGKNLVAAVLRYDNAWSFEYCEKQHLRFAQAVYEQVNPAYRSVTYLALSTIKEHINLIPASYRECTDMFKYKLSCASHLLAYATLKDRSASYSYPHVLEKQLINNLLSGNTEACRLLIDEFFQAFSDPGRSIEDNEIKSSLYYLENSILKSISGLPISITIDADSSLSNFQSIDAMKARVGEFVEKLCLAIHNKDENEEYRLHSTVMAYVEKNYMQYEFSLNKAADDLNLNRNYLSKIIREITGESFTDHINNKRISRAKQLLQDKMKTIEDIAKEVGFNYSYYFIKVFKNTEGITPGQYRNNIL